MQAGPCLQRIHICTVLYINLPVYFNVYRKRLLTRGGPGTYNNASYVIDMGQAEYEQGAGYLADPQIIALRTIRTEKKQASDTLYHTIREGIASGLLPMGTRLREEELAEVFDVSRTPVREAIKKLEIERLVESSSTSGSIVRLLTVDECLDTLEVLELLRAAACNMLMGRIPRSLLMVLEQNTRKGDSLTESGQQYENNAEFHELLVKATGNSVLIKLSGQLALTERIINNTVLPVDFADNYAERHRTLVKAIVGNDRQTVQQELDHSRRKVEDYMRRIVEAFLDVGGPQFPHQT